MKDGICTKKDSGFKIGDTYIQKTLTGEEVVWIMTEKGWEKLEDE